VWRVPLAISRIVSHNWILCEAVFTKTESFGAGAISCLQEFHSPVLQRYPTLHCQQCWLFSRKQFLTSFNVYFLFDYACFMCICLKTATIWLFWWRQVDNPAPNLKGSHAVLKVCIEKVLNCKIGFQDFEIVLNLAKMYTKYWKSMEILNSTICLFKFCSSPLMIVLQMFFALCSMSKIFVKWS